MTTGRLRWISPLALSAGLAIGVLACASGPPASPAAAGQGSDIASLQQQVASQNARIAVLETRVAGGSAAQVQPKPAPPTPTIVPPVPGIATDGTTKGSATAKVTITEYLDYL
jgi:protein-disulfide isomerase